MLSKLQRSFVKRQTSGTSSDSEWQGMKTSDNEWYNEWQGVTTNDNEWQRVVQQVTKSDNEWQQIARSDGSATTNENGTVHFKEWMIAVLSMTKTDPLLLQGMDGCN